MGSSTLGREYPGRLFPAGKSPLQDRSLHHNCKLTEFGQLKQSVGEEVFNDVMSTSQVGIILKLASRSYMWCAKTCHNLLTHQLAIESSTEIWSLFGGRPIRFSLHEFGEITQLNCKEFDRNDDLQVEHTWFWDLVGIKDGQGPSWHELNGALGRCSTWTYEQKRMLALLFVVHIGIYGISRSSRISLKHAKRTALSRDQRPTAQSGWPRNECSALGQNRIRPTEVSAKVQTTRPITQHDPGNIARGRPSFNVHATPRTTKRASRETRPRGRATRSACHGRCIRPSRERTSHVRPRIFIGQTQSLDHAGRPRIRPTPTVPTRHDPTVRPIVPHDRPNAAVDPKPF
ncbi:unnamed protein product [Microthlaspi erraticum]|uniref:DUF1985 domain-containing protein n=1 Tax=Microthlaspi erraticum TaxID=1685480 RepID=A0A6D2LDZ9_9BRAS|nr:unnamed protein product [Microthlaspi erraticum]